MEQFLSVIFMSQEIGHSRPWDQKWGTDLQYEGKCVETLSYAQ